jgi:membrane-associated phospholipid phosphatase
MENKKFDFKEPILKYNLKDVLNLVDLYVISILLLYSLTATIFFKVIIDAKSYIFLNLFIVTAIVTVATIVEKFNAGLMFKFVRNLYVVPVIFFIYTQTHAYLKIINPNDFDWLLIKWDFAIFGANPTHIFFNIANPWLTELLQLSYMLFFLMPLAVGFELYLRGKMDEFITFTRTIAFGFFVSYLLYFFLPAVGPRFTLHEFSQINSELPGVFLTSFFRELVNIGGGIYPSNFITPFESVNRDCMPSGHTMITLINMWMTYKFRAHNRYWIYFFGSGLIIATVYLRYHYVVDLIAGLIFAALVIWVEPKLRNLLKNQGWNLA